MVDSYSWFLGDLSFRVRFVSYTFCRIKEKQAEPKQTIIKSQPIKIQEKWKSSLFSFKTKNGKKRESCILLFSRFHFF